MLQCAICFKFVNATTLLDHLDDRGNTIQPNPHPDYLVCYPCAQDWHSVHGNEGCPQCRGRIGYMASPHGYVFQEFRDEQEEQEVDVDTVETCSYKHNRKTTKMPTGKCEETEKLAVGRDGKKYCPPHILTGPEEMLVKDLKDQNKMAEKINAKRMKLLDEVQAERMKAAALKTKDAANDLYKLAMDRASAVFRNAEKDAIDAIKNGPSFQLNQATQLVDVQLRALQAQARRAPSTVPTPSVPSIVPTLSVPSVEFTPLIDFAPTTSISSTPSIPSTPSVPSTRPRTTRPKSSTAPTPTPSISVPSVPSSNNDNNSSQQMDTG